MTLILSLWIKKDKVLASLLHELLHSDAQTVWYKEESSLTIALQNNWTPHLIASTWVHTASHWLGSPNTLSRGKNATATLAAL
jgi:hypothetical protein